MVKKMKEGDIVSRGGYRYQERGGKQYNFNITEPEKKKAAPVKPKPKPAMPAPAKPKIEAPKRPTSPTPKPKVSGSRFNPLTSTSIMEDGSVVTGPAAVRAKNYGDISPLPEKPKGKRFNPLTSTYYRDGGKVRGDGMARVKTKGRCL